MLEKIATTFFFLVIVLILAAFLIHNSLKGDDNPLHGPWNYPDVKRDQYSYKRFGIEVCVDSIHLSMENK